MHAEPGVVLTGVHYLDGDHACAEGALAAGCRFFAGYPITPSTEIAERIARRFPRVGGVFLQMEDEMAAMAAVIGAVWGGTKAMTCTSGPGFSLMMENLGLAVMMETPCVLVNVQRGGPSTGLPTMVGQADVMQARWGSHGDYQIIALAPNSPQEAFDLTIVAFNLSEQYRVPVLVMMDECVGHMTEKVVIPEANRIEVLPRRHTRVPPAEYLPYRPGDDLVPEMVAAGEGYRIHSTGLTHDERGYPVMTAEAQNALSRLRALLALPESTVLLLTDSLLTSRPTTCPDAACALDTRGDVRALAAGRDAAGAARKGAWAAQLPQLGAFGTVAYHGHDTPWSSGSKAWGSARASSKTSASSQTSKATSTKRWRATRGRSRPTARRTTNTAARSPTTTSAWRARTASNWTKRSASSGRATRSPSAQATCTSRGCAW